MLVAAPDAFPPVSAVGVAEALCRGAARVGWRARMVPMGDGGPGLLEVVGGRRRTAVVSGPLGRPVDASFALLGGGSRLTAVVEGARASGLALAGGPSGNEPLGATTKGTGELVLAAVAAGARRIVVGCGGSASTDGGLGAVRAIGSRSRLGGAVLSVACDVTTQFLDAARAFAPAKGASHAEVALLSGRLARVAQAYGEEFGVDVTDMAGAGAGGGLAGGLAALGAQLRPGAELVAELTGLSSQIDPGSVVVTGEPFLDGRSFAEGVVGAVAELAREAGARVLCMAQGAAGSLFLPPHSRLVCLDSPGPTSDRPTVGKDPREHGERLDETARLLALLEEAVVAALPAVEGS